VNAQVNSRTTNQIGSNLQKQRDAAAASQAAKVAAAAKAKAETDAKITSAISLADAAKATEARLADPRLGSAKLLADAAEESVARDKNPIIVGLKNSLECLPGRNRLANDANFFLLNETETNIGVDWQPGSIKEGTVTQTYVGVSDYRDLMFLSRISKSGQVIGHNLTLSFCDTPRFPGGMMALSNEGDAHLVDFRSPNGITINKDTSCGYGLIEAAINTVIVTRISYTINPLRSDPRFDKPTIDYPLFTSFVKPNCI
jgi:hypothetical protein